MPLVACPECGAHTRVASENLGRTIECAECRRHFAAAAELDSWTRFLTAKHRASYQAGLALLMLAAMFAVVVFATVRSHDKDLYSALFGRGALPWARILFWIAFASLAIGSLLIYRHRRALSRWPRH